MTRKSINDPFLALRIAEFRNLLIGRFFFRIGLRMMITIVGWWVYELTNSALAIGMIGLAEVIPAVALALYGGHVMDKSEKRKMLLKGILLYLVCSLLLAFVAKPNLTGTIGVHWVLLSIYTIIFFTGVLRAFTSTLFSVLTNVIIPKDKLPNATTASQAAFISASAIGHASGGFMIAHWGEQGGLVGVFISLLVAFVAVYKIHPKPIDKTIATVQKSVLKSMHEGLQFVYKTKELLGAMTLDLFAVFFGGAVTMIPVFAKDILHIGAIGFGWLNAASDMGAIPINFLLLRYPLRKKQGKSLFYFVAAFGICIIVFGLSKMFWLSFIALLIGGAVDAISANTRATILQLKTPSNMSGRVMSVASMFINSSNELGQFESGLAASLMGNVPSVVFGGVMTLIVVAIVWVQAPAVRKMEY